MIRKPISFEWRMGLAAGAVLLLVLGYVLLSMHQHSKNENDTSIPSAAQLFEGVKTITSEQGLGKEVWLLKDAEASLWRFSLGAGCGAVIAIFLGFLMGCWAPAEAFLSPPVTFMGKLNPMAMLAVFFVLVGTDSEFYTAVIAFGVFPGLATTIYLSAKYDVPDELINKTYTLGASHFEVIANVIGRQVLPKLLEGLRLMIGPALVYLIAAEMLVGGEGFGYRIRINMRLTRMDVVFPYILILALFGYSLDFALKQLLAWLCPWYVKETEEKAVKEGLWGNLWAKAFGEAK